MPIEPKNLNNQNIAYGNKNFPHAWQSSLNLLFGGSDFAGLVEDFDNGNYQMVIDDAKERLGTFTSFSSLSNMNEADLATFYYLGEAYYKLQQIETATGCYHVVLSQRGFSNHMLTSPVAFSEYVEKAERRLIEISRAKGEPFVNDYDMDLFFGSTMKKSGCFIATAAYSSPVANEVMLFRQFRDDVLLESKLGSLLVALYYRCSPPFAKIISKSRLLRSVTRVVLLQPLLTFLKSDAQRKDHKM